VEWGVTLGGTHYNPFPETQELNMFVFVAVLA
jgi:hypothetical protein